MTFVILFVLTYLIGAFPSAYVVGKLLKKDILSLGSGNMGTANALRNLGKIPGLVVFTLDAGKGLLILVLGRVMGYSGILLWWLAVAAILGHIYPIYLRFRGGKGLATGLAVTAWLQPWVVFIFAVLWIAVFWWKRHVALASSMGVWGVAFYLAWFGLYPGVWIALIIIWRHWPETRAFIFESMKKEPSQS